MVINALPTLNAVSYSNDLSQLPINASPATNVWQDPQMTTFQPGPSLVSSETSRFGLLAESIRNEGSKSFIWNGHMTSSLPDGAGAAGLNPYQLATDSTAHEVADLYRSMTSLPVSLHDSSQDFQGPFKPDVPNNQIEIGGHLLDAGLVAQRIQLFGPDLAMRQLQDELRMLGVPVNS